MKERLTGAIILVALLVLLVPELLTGPPRPAGSGTNVPASSSSPEEPPLRSYTINLADDSRAHANSTVGGGPAMPSGPEQPTTAPGAGSSSSSTQPDQEASTTPAAPESAAVSVAPSQSTSGPATSNQAAPELPVPARPRAPPQRPAAQSQAVPSRTVPSTAPPTAKAQTHKTAAQTPKATAKVPAQKAAPAGNPAGEFMVQLGVFASRENAEHLALEVRVKGFKASVSEVSGSGRKLFRVRVGPAADRAAALELQTRLKAAGRPGGSVVPYS